MTSETLYLLPDESIVKDLPEGVECYSVLHTTLKAAERDVYYRLAWLFGSELADRMFSAVLSQMYLRGVHVEAAEHQGASYYALAPMPTDEFLGYVGRADGQLLAKELMAKQSIVNEAATQASHEAGELKRWERSLEDWADELEVREQALALREGKVEARESALWETLGALRAPYRDQS